MKVIRDNQTDDVIHYKSFTDSSQRSGRAGIEGTEKGVVERDDLRNGTEWRNSGEVQGKEWGEGKGE